MGVKTTEIRELGFRSWVEGGVSEFRNHVRAVILEAAPCYGPVSVAIGFERLIGVYSGGRGRRRAAVLQNARTRARPRR